MKHFINFIYCYIFDYSSIFQTLDYDYSIGEVVDTFKNGKLYILRKRWDGYVDVIFIDKLIWK